MILFGPPGTGKTSFAKAIASRLGWPFVELFPSRLAATSTGGLAASLREAFAELAELDELVLFIDEVEEIATARSGATTAELGVTNELLKLIPTFRQKDSRLLVCATNAVHSLDSAFLRPGRFDYVIPVGPPISRPAARCGSATSARPACMSTSTGWWARRVLHPADIEFAARKARRRPSSGRCATVAANRPPPRTTSTRSGGDPATLTADMLAEFERGKAEFARV